MSDVTIWHNPHCSKSRAALALLQARGVEPRVVRYLDNPPDATELTRVLGLLGMTPLDLLRRGEAIARDLELGETDAAQLIAAMTKHPQLIERPVVIRAERAVIGRPPERVLEIL